MAYTFRLEYDNQSLKVANDPIGWDETNFVVKRSKKDGHGTFKNFNLELTWIKDGAQFVRDIYESAGIEALIKVEVYLYDPNNNSNGLILSGKLNLTEYSVNTDRGRLEVTAPIENNKFITQFLSLKKKDVDLTLAEDIKGNAIAAIDIVDSSLHSKSISQEYKGQLTGDQVTTVLGSTNIGTSSPNDSSRNITSEFWVPLSMDKEIKGSLQKAFALGTGTGTYDFNSVGNFFQFDFDTKATINANIPQLLEMNFSADHSKGRVNCSSNGKLFEILTFQFFFEWRDKDNNLKQRTLIGNKSANLCGVGTIFTDEMTLGDGSSLFNKEETEYLKGDKLYFYSYIKHVGNYKRLIFNSWNLNQEYKITIPEHEQTFIEIAGVSVFGETTTEGVMVYEAFEHVVRHLTGQQNSFKSDYFGRTELGYLEDGPGALRLLAKGKNLRGVSIDESIFMSFDLLMEQIAIDAISFGFEEENGETIVRVEPIEFFYETGISLTLDRVSKLNKKAIAEKYITTIDLGYQKWTGQKDIGTLFEINSERQYYTGLTQIDKEEKQLSKLVTGSYSIESMRRLSIDLDTKDGQYDDDVFIIQVLRNPDPVGTVFISESDESLENISGVEDPEGLYNIRLTPARNLIRWGRVIASSFFKNGTVEGTIKFASGKGNYQANSKLTSEQQVKENGDFDISQFEPIWLNEQYDFEYPLTLDELNILMQETKKTIKFTDNNGNEFFGFIIEVEVDIRTPGESLSTFKLLRAK